MTAADSTCHKQAIIETEQCFLGSVSKEHLFVPGIVEINDQQRMASFLDLHTIRMVSVSDWKKAGSLMKSQYIEFTVQWYHFEHEASCKEAEAKKHVKCVLNKSTSKEESTTIAIPTKKKLKAEFALYN
jgi:hypothetical protein